VLTLKDNLDEHMTDQERTESLLDQGDGHISGFVALIEPTEHDFAANSIRTGNVTSLVEDVTDLLIERGIDDELTYPRDLFSCIEKYILTHAIALIDTIKLQICS